MSLILIGYRGSGKTTLGQAVAARLGMKFVDVDQRIIQQTGKTIREIFEQRKEAGFRELESAAINEALKLEDQVIALGGGALGLEDNRRAIQSSGHGVIYLHCEAGELLKRIEGDPATADNRPNLGVSASTREEIERLLPQREPIYRLVMTAELDVTDLTPPEAVERIVEMLQSPPG